MSRLGPVLTIEPGIVLSVLTWACLLALVWWALRNVRIRRGGGV